MRGRCLCRDHANLPNVGSVVGHGTYSCIRGSLLVPHTLDVSVDLQSATQEQVYCCFQPKVEHV